MNFLLAMVLKVCKCYFEKAGIQNSGMLKWGSPFAQFLIKNKQNFNNRRIQIFIDCAKQGMS